MMRLLPNPIPPHTCLQPQTKPLLLRRQCSCRCRWCAGVANAARANTQPAKTAGQLASPFYNADQMNRRSTIVISLLLILIVLANCLFIDGGPYCVRAWVNDIRLNLRKCSQSEQLHSIKIHALAVFGIYELFVYGHTARKLQFVNKTEFLIN